MNLFKSAHSLIHKNDFKSPSGLGLAEFALEELGKSYMCLAYYNQAKSNIDWKIFWKEWRNHDTKAHRAFFYEFFCLLRVDIDDPLYNIPTRRTKFSLEKEASFYVDIDKNTRHIHIPDNEIEIKEQQYRLFSLIGLLNGALKVRDKFKDSSSDFFRQAISDHAYNFLTNDLYQQDVRRKLNKMKNSNSDYNLGLEFIDKLFDTSAN